MILTEAPGSKAMCPHRGVFCGQQLVLVSELLTVKAHVANNSINSHSSNVILVYTWSEAKIKALP